MKQKKLQWNSTNLYSVYAIRIRKTDTIQPALTGMLVLLNSFDIKWTGWKGSLSEHWTLKQMKNCEGGFGAWAQGYKVLLNVLGMQRLYLLQH